MAYPYGVTAGVLVYLVLKCSS